MKKFIFCVPSTSLSGLFMLPLIMVVSVWMFPPTTVADAPPSQKKINDSKEVVIHSHGDPANSLGDDSVRNSGSIRTQVKNPNTPKEEDEPEVFRPSREFYFSFGVSAPMNTSLFDPNEVLSYIHSSFRSPIRTTLVRYRNVYLYLSMEFFLGYMSNRIQQVDKPRQITDPTFLMFGGTNGYLNWVYRSLIFSPKVGMGMSLIHIKNFTHKNQTSTLYYPLMDYGIQITKIFNRQFSTTIDASIFQLFAKPVLLFPSMSIGFSIRF